VLFEAMSASGTTVLRGRLPSSDNLAIIEAGRTDFVSQRMRLTEARSRWQYWTFTKNGDTGHMKIYLNGALWADAAGKTEVLEPAAAFAIGAKCDGTLGYEGKIDEFRVYDRELQPSEIADLYNMGGQRGDRGLMGWWRLDELSGTTVKDWSDLRNDGVLHGAARQAGVVGNCLLFNRATDFVEVPVDGLTFQDPAVTLCVWTYGDSSLPAPANTYGSLAVHALTKDGFTSLLASIPFPDGTAFFRAGGDAGRDTKITAVLQPDQYKGKWNHWVFARSHGGLATIYLNGASIANDLNSSGDVCGVMGQFRIGAGCLPDPGLGSSPFKGKLDEIRLYNYELPPDDILRIYNSDLTNFSGQIGGWKFDEGSGVTTADTTKFGNNGTVNNANWAAGRIDSGLRFTGVNSYVSMPAAALASLDKQITVTLWLNSAGQPRGANWIFEALDSAGGPTGRAMVDANQVVFDSGFGGSGQFDEVERVLQGASRAGVWTHWAFTKNAISGNMNIYRDGVLWQRGVEKYRPLTPAVVFKIGSTADGSLGFIGVIDDVRVYNLELNQADIFNIYLDSPPLPNPMAWFVVPHAVGRSSISMRAVVASHPNGVEYYFANVNGGGNDSGWQASPNYTDAGLEPGVYSYRVKARERSPNQRETDFSPIRSATIPGSMPR
jgi:Concanavalin A-like lectin/glucanases superfamily